MLEKPTIEIKIMIFKKTLQTLYKKFSNLNRKSFLKIKTIKPRFKANCYVILNAMSIYKKSYITLCGAFILILVLITEFFILFYLNSFNLIRLFANWLTVFLLAYTLYFSFILLFKRSRFSKFTASIIKFWKRTLTIFWAIEAFLFIFFVFVTLNTSQEPAFFIDQSLYVKNFQVSWKFFYFSFMLTAALINMLKYLSTSNSFTIFENFLYKSFTLVLFLLFLLNEFSQLFFVTTFYNSADWFNELFAWYLEFDITKLRAFLHYINLCVMLKFWHFFLIFLYFIFFSLNTFFFKNNINNFFSGLIQNLIIYYILSAVIYIYWTKHTFKFLINECYTFFYLNTDWATKYNFFVNFCNELYFFFIN